MRSPTRHLTQPGWVIAFAVLVLLITGIVAILGSQTVQVGGRAVQSREFAERQILFACVGLMASAVVLRIGYMRIAQHAYLIFGVCLALLVPMLVAKYLETSFGGVVPDLRGAYRWIRLPGFQLQPSELMKLGYILALAWYLRYRRNYRTFGGLMTPFLISIVPMVLILKEPDLGTVLLFLPVLFGMLFVAGARIKHLATVIAFGIVVAPLACLNLQPYQRGRIAAVVMQSETLRQRIVQNPKDYEFTGVTKQEALEWKVSSGMQLVRSKAALGSGGMFGQGWGRGTYVEHNFLPDRHNDFVFAIVGHQWGLLGCLVVLGCYVLIVVAGVEIASVTTEPLGRLVAMGVVCLISAQVVINVGMTVGLMPVTGMTLPFVSYGGSSLLTNFMAAALLVSVSQYRPFSLAKKPFEWGEDRNATVTRS